MAKGFNSRSRGRSMVPALLHARIHAGSDRPTKSSPLVSNLPFSSARSGRSSSKAHLLGCKTVVTCQCAYRIAARRGDLTTEPSTGSGAELVLADRASRATALFALLFPTLGTVRAMKHSAVVYRP
jgi:hypothetical protein